MMRSTIRFFSLAGVCLLALSLHSAVIAGQLGGRDLALCVGVGQYPTPPSLTAPADDARAIGDILEATGQYRKVIVLSDAAGDKRLAPTGKNITDMLTLLARTASRDANIVFYFSGRGSAGDGAARILPGDAGEEGGIDLSTVASILNGSKAGGKTMLLDAAWPGSGNGGLTGETPLDGVAVMVSCQPGQQSRIDEESGRGLFSLALENTLRDAVGAPLSLGELADGIDLFISDYCLDHLVVEGQSAALPPTDRDTAFLPAFASTADSSSPAPTRRPATTTTSIAASSASAGAASVGVRDLLRRAEEAFDRKEYDKALPLFARAAELGNAEAENWLGDLYFDGCGVERDYDAALRHYRQAAEMGLAQAQCNVGYMYCHALSVENDYVAAKKWFELSSAQGCVDALYHLYWIYNDGHDVPADTERAGAIIAQALEQGLGERVRQRAEQGWSRECLIYSTLFSDGIGVAEDERAMTVWERKAAEKGLALAQVYYGNSYFLGSGDLEQDYSTAFEWYAKAAEQGNARGQYMLGELYYNGMGVERDYSLAVQWHEKAAKQGNASAQNSLGIIHYNGEGVPRDYSRAVQWFRKAAESGHAKAQNNLGSMYDDGEGVAQDYSQAVHWYRKAAEQGYTLAQRNLAVSYYNGEGVSQDYSQAMQWFRRAAESGDAVAQNSLGVMYESAGTNQDNSQAVYWYKKAAEQGNTHAQKNLGVCYYNGEGVSQDYSQAIRWFRKAAEQENPIALDYLGNCYSYGRGVPVDYSRAMQLYKQAADLGNANAAHSLGVMYADGTGVTQNNDIAIQWLERAKTLGNSMAESSIAIVRENIEFKNRQAAAHTQTRSSSGGDPRNNEYWVVCECWEPDCLFCYDEEAIAAGKRAEASLRGSNRQGSNTKRGGGSLKAAGTLMGIAASVIPLVGSSIPIGGK